MEKKYDILGIGNAIVDVLAYKDEAFLATNGLTKGGMTLVTLDEAEKVYREMGAATECSGGSAANTLAGFSMLGGNAAFIGKVKKDQLGDIFRHDITSSGVKFVSEAAVEGAPTAHCLIFVTKEESQFENVEKIERTMATYLGASVTISEDDIDEELIKQSKIIYFEGYLWDSPSAKKAIEKAVKIAKENGVKVAFTLSDALCVDRHRADFLAIIKEYVDILFANEHEIEALYQETDMRKILYKVSAPCGDGGEPQANIEIVAITRSEKGSYVISGGSIYNIDAEKVENVYDVTGAGDLYASGLLYGYVNDLGFEKSGKLASLCAAEVIKYIGARPATKLELMLEKL